MTQTLLDATPLADEYQWLVKEATNRRHGINWNRLQQGLANDLEWTPQAAGHLVHLVRKYGAFMLRNALALAVAAEIEDGDLVF